MSSDRASFSLTPQVCGLQGNRKEPITAYSSTFQFSFKIKEKEEYENNAYRPDSSADKACSMHPVDNGYS